MGDKIPYGPNQLPWKETVAAAAIISDSEYLVSPPSQDPIKTVYSKCAEKKEIGITQKYYQVPSKGMTADEARQAQNETFLYTAQQTKEFLGYQLDLRNDYSIASKYLNTQINNIGDPFTPGTFTLNSKWMERNVLDYYASLWNAKWPHDPKDPDTYWGYVLTMGSTEANLYGIWNARDYLQGKFMMEDKSSEIPRTYYVRAKTEKGNRNALTPVAFYSQDTHYSVIKAMAVMEVDTFFSIGSNKYPGKCPITWSGGKKGEWPYEVPSQDSGSIDIGKLVKLVRFFAKEGYPPLIIMNYGTTFKGAYDDVKAATDGIMPILREHNLETRKIKITDPDTGKFVLSERKGYWFHVDGALGATYMPFIKMARLLGKTNVDPAPEFDFKIPYVCSINTSGHKWPGAPWPCGIYMTKTGLQLLPPSNPTYTGSADTTFGGSRNGLSCLNWWTYISTYNYDSQIEKVYYCLDMVDYTCNELKTKITGRDIWLDSTPLTLSIRFKKPNDKITHKYTLAVEIVKVNGEDRTYVHIYMMNHVTKDTINSLVKDLQSPDAWESDQEIAEKKAALLAQIDKEKPPYSNGLILQKKDAGLRKGTMTILEWPRQGRGFL